MCRLFGINGNTGASGTVHTRKHGSYRRYKRTPLDIYMQCFMQLNKEANIHIDGTKRCNKLLFKANNPITFIFSPLKNVKNGCAVLLI